METVLQDIRVTLRTFRRSPGFPLAAIAGDDNSRDAGGAGESDQCVAVGVT
jgi:hypothetical protein